MADELDVLLEKVVDAAVTDPGAIHCTSQYALVPSCRVR